MFVTMLIFYLTYPVPKVVLVSPNTEDLISDVYKDNGGVCYRYHRKYVDCN